MSTRPAQLPLPHRTFIPPPQPIVSKPATLNIPTATLSASLSANSPRSPTSSALSAPSLHLQEREPSPFSPPAVQSTFPHLHISSTHAGGIQPSASFFHPSKPIQQHQSNLSSDTSATSPILSPDTATDLYQLAPLTKQHSNGSDDPFGSTLDDNPRQSSKRYKHSREPLLPFVASPPPSTTRGSTGTGTGAAAGSFTTRSGRVRSSFERMFKRGLSLESLRKSTSTGSAPFNRKLGGGGVDEEDEVGGRGEDKSSQFKMSSSRSAALRHAVPPSPDPSAFTSSPPQQDLSAVPLKDPATGRWIRKYERHPSRNKFFFNGRLLTGGDSPYAFIASSTLVLAIAGVWFGTTSVWWWKNESAAVALVGSYMCLITISSMIATATRDPGILPRNLDPDPPYAATTTSDGGTRTPMPRDLKVRSDVVRVKYCPTCKTYRPPRSSHCKMCDNCVDGCDHHCQWVNNCVGRRNYTSFFTFLTFATVTLVLVICTSALHIYLITRKEDVNFVRALRKAPGSVTVFCLSISVVWPVAALLSYHLRLLLLNVTTIEQIRNQAHKTLVPGPAPPNPFSYGSWRRNLVGVLGRPTGFSYLDGGGILTEDKREVNPGMVT